MQEKIIQSEVVRSVYDSIKELHLNYCEELEETKRELQRIENAIKDTKDYLSYLSNHQNSDAFVFSPRGVISKNTGNVQDGSYDTSVLIDFSDTQKKKEELVDLEDSKKKCEEKINKLNSTIAVLLDNKDILKEVISLKDSFEEEKKILEEKKDQVIKEYVEKREAFSSQFEKGSLEKLTHISHTIDLMDSYVLHDPMRVKLELKNMKQNVSSVSENLKQLIGVPEGDI